jgi:hypothetical protein
MIQLHSDIDDTTAAALPDAIAGSATVLRFRACMQPGDTVLINAATALQVKQLCRLQNTIEPKK